MRRWSAGIGVWVVVVVGVAATASAGQRPSVPREVPSAITVISAQDVERLPVCVRSFERMLRQVPVTPALDIEHVDVPPASPGSGPLTWTWGGATKPLDEPFCVDEREMFRQPIRYERDGTPVGSILLHLTAGAPKAPVIPNAGTRLYMAPLLLPAEVQTIRGAFSGTTSITVNGVAAQVLSQTPQTVYWMVPSDLAPAGPAVTVTVKNDGRTVNFTSQLLTLEMAADQLHLLKGQSTGLHAAVSGPDRVARPNWVAGDVSEVIDQTKLAELFPGVKVPKAGEPAMVLFRLDNASRDTVSMSPSKNETFSAQLGHAAFASGPYRYTGKIQSRKAGDFNVTGVVVAFFAPVPGTPDTPR